jgi:hypothetical protein
VVLFLGDFFDNCFEYISIFDEILSSQDNTAVILFNIPGQAYTVFNEERTYDNFVVCEIIDRLLNELNER